MSRKHSRGVFVILAMQTLPVADTVGSFPPKHRFSPVCFLADVPGSTDN